MGADLISTFAWYKTGPLEEVSRTLSDGRVMTWEHAPPLLDFEAGRTKLRELAPTWTKEQIDQTIDTRSLHDEVEDLIPTDVDDPDEYDSNEEARMAILNAALEDIDAVQSIFTGEDKNGERVNWRDVDQRTFDTGVGFIFSGGLSWGDTPTEAYDHLTNLQDEDYTPGGSQVWEAIGFIVDPYKVIGLVAAPQHPFVSADGIHCDTCQLLQANARHA